MTKRFMFMLDSGAYTVWSKGIKISLEQYAGFVQQHKHLFRGGVWNFDVIGSDKGSYENWLELHRLGADTIPIFHIGDDESYLIKYLDQCEFVGIGAIAKMDAKSRILGLDHVWKAHLLLSDGKPRCRIHGLGLTDTSIVLRYPWYSVDSTRCIAAAAYGTILLPILKGSEASYANLMATSVSDQTRKVELSKTLSSGSSFFLFPPRLQASIREFVESNGWTISQSLEGRVLRPTMRSRKKKDALWINGLGIEDVVAEREENVENSNNLSSNWQSRYAFNLLMVDRFVEHWRQQGKVVRIYNVVGGGQVFDEFALSSNSHPANRALVSYIKAEGLLSRLEQAVNGSSEKSSLNGNQASLASNGTEGTLRAGKQDSIRGRKSSSVQRLSRDSTPVAWRPES